MGVSARNAKQKKKGGGCNEPPNSSYYVWPAILKKFASQKQSEYASRGKKKIEEGKGEVWASRKWGSCGGMFPKEGAGRDRQEETFSRESGYQKKDRPRGKKSRNGK